MQTLNCKSGNHLQEEVKHALDHICNPLRFVRTGFDNRLHAGQRHSCPVGHRHYRGADKSHSGTKTSVTIFDVQQPFRGQFIPNLGCEYILKNLIWCDRICQSPMLF